MTDSEPEQHQQQSPPRTQESSPPEHPAAAAADVQVQNDDDDEDADSALGEDLAESTASLSASILEYRTIQGRRYHSERGNALYWGTNDERQSDALDIKYVILPTLSVKDIWDVRRRRRHW